MRISNKVLGILALAGAPWLFIGGLMEEKMPYLSDSWFTGLWGILFISGWMCSVIGLHRLKATGGRQSGRLILIILLMSLAVANVSNVIQLVVEKDKPAYFPFLDFFWPLSNVIMLIVGLTVIVVKGLPSWKRFIPLATGLWFPLAMLSSLTDDTILAFIFGGFYSALAWTLLSVVIMTTEKTLHTR